MGAGNVKEAYVRWAHLPHAPFRLLTYMCVVSNDGDAPRFWAGQDVMALAMNLPLDTAKERQSSLRSVRRHIEALCEAKVIERTRAGAPGRNAEYTLRLSMGRRAVEALREAADVGHPEPSDVDGNGGHPEPSDDTERRTLGVHNGGHPVAHRRTLGGTSEDTHNPPEEEQDHKRTRENEVETAAGRSPASAPKRSRARSPAREAPGRCAECQTDHSGQTCDEYRRGDDKPAPTPRRRRAK